MSWFKGEYATEMSEDDSPAPVRTTKKANTAIGRSGAVRSLAVRPMMFCNKVFFGRAHAR